MTLEVITDCDHLWAEGRGMSDSVALVRGGGLDGRILLLRGLRAMRDADLAEVYGVTTARLNEQVRRNLGRLPADFMFQLSPEEKGEVIANCDQAQVFRHPALRLHRALERQLPRERGSPSNAQGGAYLRDRP